MKFEFIDMTLDYVNQIKTWKYNGFVKDIYVEPYYSSLKELNGKMKGPAGCEGFAVLYKDSLAGLFEYYFKNEIMEIGLALNPEFVGKGLGKEFVQQGIFFGIKRFNYKEEYIKLTVNFNNKPAINVYKQLGFKEHTRIDEEIEMRMVIPY